MGTVTVNNKVLRRTLTERKTMKYEEALELWGATKLIQHLNPSKPTKDHKLLRTSDVTNVKVKLVFNEGYACCGGTDPHCYCSFAESPSANVEISGLVKGTHYGINIDHYSFDFATMIKELVEYAGKVEA